jgi:hypothetical protein
MKIRILFSAIIATLISTAALHAQATYYFYGLAGYGNGVDNNWNTSSADWYGSPAFIPWVNGNAANFSTVPTTVTISEAGINATDVSLANGYTITGNTLGIINGGYNGISVGSGTATVSSYIDASAGGMTNYGNGTLKLDGGAVIGGALTIGNSTNGTIWFDAGNYTVTGYTANYASNGTYKFTLGGATVNLSTLYASGNIDFATAGPLSGDYVIANYTSLNGTFANVLDLPTGYTLDYNYNSANEIALVAAPEPSTWAMLLGGLGMLAMFRRRRA